MIFFAFLVAVSATSMDDNYFRGFIQGLRSSTTVASPCLNSIDATVYAAEAFDKSLTDKSSSISGRVHNFQTMVNVFTNTANICKLQSLTNNIQAVLVSIQGYANNVYDPYAIYLLTKVPQINENWARMISSKKIYDKGFYFGLVFSTVFRYNI